MEHAVMKNVHDMNQGTGSLFIGPAGTEFDMTQLEFLGSIKGDDGIVMDLPEEFFKHESGSQIVDVELIQREFTFKFVLTEVNAQVFQKILGSSDIEVTPANAAATFTNQKVTLYGNNFQTLPYNNITITSVSTSTATPADLNTTDIAYRTGQSAGSNDGCFKRSTTSNITNDPDGTVIYVSGTYKHNEIDSVAVDVPARLNIYPMYIRKRLKDGNWDTYYIWQATRVSKIDEIAMKKGQPYTIGATFQALYDGTQGSVVKYAHEKYV